MASDQIFNPSFWFVLLALLAISLPLYVLALWKSWKWAILALFLIVGLGVYTAFYSVHNFGGAFGPGMILSCLAVFLVPISIILLILLRHPFIRKFPDNILRNRLYFWGGVLIIFSQMVPFFGSYTVDAVCYRTTRQNAAPLITAIEAYFEQKGTYPEKIEILQPAYLVEIPVPGCSWLSTQGNWPPPRFEIQTCNNGTVLLTNESTDGTSIQRYNFNTGNWSSISFLDGSCSHLR